MNCQFIVTLSLPYSRVCPFGSYLHFIARASQSQWSQDAVWEVVVSFGNCEISFIADHRAQVSKCSGFSKPDGPAPVSIPCAWNIALVPAFVKRTSGIEGLIWQSIHFFLSSWTVVCICKSIPSRLVPLIGQLRFEWAVRQQMSFCHPKETPLPRSSYLVSACPILSNALIHAALPWIFMPAIPQ